MAEEKDLFAPLSEQEKLSIQKEQEMFAPLGSEERELLLYGPPATTEEKAMATASGMASGATFGYLPEIKAGLEPAIEAGLEMATGIELDPRQKQDSFAERLDKARAEQKAIRERAPGYALAGELAGFVTPGVGVTKALGAGGKLLKASRIADVSKATKGAGMATKSAKLAQSRGGKAFVAEKILESAGNGLPMKLKVPTIAAIGAAEGYLYNPEESGISREESALSTGVFGGVLPLGGKALSKVPDVAKNALQVITGVEVKNMNRYLNNPKLMENAKTQEEIASIINDVIRPIRQEVIDASVDVKEAKGRLAFAERTMINGFADKTKEIKTAFQMAKTDLDIAYKSSYDQLNRVAPPIHLTDSILESQRLLKERIIEGSDAAIDILDQKMGDTLIPLSSAVDAAKSELSEVMIQGKTSLEGKVWAQNIQDIIENLEQWEGGLTPRELKKYIKQIDRSLENAWDEGSWQNPDKIALKKVRQAIDRTLKMDESYATAMQEVSADMSIYQEFRQKAGKEEALQRFLSRIDKPNNNYERKILTKFLERTESGVGDEIFEYIAIKNKVKELDINTNARLRFRNTLPEAIPYEEAKRRLEQREAITRVQKQEILEQAKRQSDEAAALQLAEDRLLAAKDAQNQIITFTERNSEQKVKNLINTLNNGPNGSGLVIKEEFKKLTALSDVDFEAMVNTLSLNRAFDKTFLRGQRNVGLWSAVGLAAGGATGIGLNNLAGGSGAGLATGAILGAVIDTYGPSMTKQMLSAVIAIRGLPTRSKILRMAIPARAKAYLINDFESTLLSAWSGSPLKIDPEDMPAIREDIRRNEEFSASQKATLLNDLNKSGLIRNPIDYFGEYEPPKPKSPMEYRPPAIFRDDI